jgi:hypothetical protein
MRALVLVLAGLAGLKIWAHDHVYRSAAEEALVQAYRERAIEACQKDRRSGSKGAEPKTPATAWTSPAAIRLVIGRRDVDVAIWDVENVLWPVRYKYPVLVLTAGAHAPDLTCEYDVMVGTASLLRPRA